MSTQIEISIPQELYQRMSNLARQRNLPLTNVLDTALSLAEATPQMAVADPDEAMRREIEAFHHLHPDLVQHYLQQYVAIYQGQLVDYDDEQLALLARIEEKYPTEVVLLRRVGDEPEPVELRVYSPRFV